MNHDYGPEYRAKVERADRQLEQERIFWIVFVLLLVIVMLAVLF